MKEKRGRKEREVEEEVLITLTGHVRSMPCTCKLDATFSRKIICYPIKIFIRPILNDLGS